MAPATQCLDIAIDRRIRRIMGHVQIDTRQADHSSAHTDILKTRGHHLQRSSAEINVTADLASPMCKGGIVVLLQQPAANHPYEKGTRAVIDDSPTLRGLKAAFTAISCGGIDMQRDVSIIDLLPYLTNKDVEAATADAETWNPYTLHSSCLAASATVVAQAPRVILCAGRLWMPPLFTVASKPSIWAKITEPIRAAESCGVGKTFAPRIVNLVGPEGDVQIAHRANCFHPSIAMRWYKTYSIFRQLLLLSVAEACGRYRGLWQEESWMQDLRDEAATTFASLRRGRTFDEFNCRTSMWFSQCVGRIEDAVLSLNSTHNSGSYKSLVESQLGTRINDAHLVLCGLPAFTRYDSDVELCCITVTEQLLHCIQERISKINVRKRVEQAVAPLRAHVGRTRFQLDGSLKGLADAYLKAAECLEEEMTSLRRFAVMGRDDEDIYTIYIENEVDNDLSHRFGNLHVNTIRIIDTC